MAQTSQGETAGEISSTESDTEYDDTRSEVNVAAAPEFRLVERNDPEAFNFNTSQYSAHKLPKDVVDASLDGEAGLRDFMGQWREIVAAQERQERESES